MATTRFYLRKKDIPNKETLILLYFSYNNKRAIVSTELTIQPRYWNNKEQKARSTRGQIQKSDFINEQLQEHKNAIESAYKDFKKKGIEPAIDELKEQYRIQLLPPELIEKEVDFWEEYEKFIESSKGRVVKDVIKDYHALKKHLLGFQKRYKRKISFENFNYSFYEKFIKYLTYDAVKPNGEPGLSTNTVGKQIKNLKVFLNHCFKLEIVERTDLSSFKTLTEESDAIYLTEKEVEKIYHTDLSGYPELEESRDLLVLGCQVGLRSSDLFRLKPEMLRNNMIHIRMKKSGKNVVIPLQPIASEIVQQYGGDFPNKNNKNTFNADVKKIGKLASIDENIVFTHKRGNVKEDRTYKKYELISSHTCRRSFCTNQYLKGVPTVLLMKISGHKTEKAFLRYIKIDEEMAAHKIAEFWDVNS
jgi:integrase